MFGVLSLPLPSRPLAGWLVDLIHFAFSLLSFSLSYTHSLQPSSLSLPLHSLFLDFLLFIFSARPNFPLSISLFVQRSFIHVHFLVRTKRKKGNKGGRKGGSVSPYLVPLPYNLLLSFFFLAPFNKLPFFFPRDRHGYHYSTTQPNYCMLTSLPSHTFFLHKFSFPLSAKEPLVGSPTGHRRDPERTG